MASYLHVTNAAGRDATIGIAAVPTPPAPAFGLPQTALTFRRYLAAAESGTHTALAGRPAADYAQALVTGDPDIHLERVGQFIEHTVPVYLDATGQVLQVDPKFVELVLGPDGAEKERRAPVDTTGNVNIHAPVRWTGRKVPLADAVRRFSFQRRLQLQHVDGLTYDYLHAMARDLEQAQSLMLLGTGEKGTGPLIFQSNGRAYRGFLSGATDGPRYRLLLHLSDMELKRPAEPRA